MTKLLLPLRTLTFSLALALTAGAPAFAQSPYTTARGFDVSFLLDPRAFPELFPHGTAAGDTVSAPGFGSARVLTGMDFDGDGRKEFLFATDETLAPLAPDPGILDVYLYESTGDDAYEHVWHYTHTDSTNSNPPITYGDLDKDGLWEIYMGIPTLVASGSTDKLFVFEQNADKTFPTTPTLTYGYERTVEQDFRPSAFEIADIDGDGQEELLTTSRTSASPTTMGREAVVISPIAGIDAFTEFKVELVIGNEKLAGGTIFDSEIVDFDGDGRMEIWINTWDKLSMTIFEATGPDTYVEQVDLNAIYDDEDPDDEDHGTLEGMSFVDIDGDDRLELIYPSTEGQLIIGLSTTDVATLDSADFPIVGTFAPGRFSPGDANRGGDAGNLDGDELIDIVANSGRDEELFWIEYTGTGAVTDSASYTWTTIVTAEPDTSTDVSDGFFYPLEIAEDLDGDGFNEIVMANRRASTEGQPIVLIFETNADLSTASEKETARNGYTLRSYPNPFAAAARVAFETPVAGEVRVELFDLRGKLVKTLFSGTVPAGAREVSISGTGLSSGLYFVRLTTPNQVLTTKATLIR